MRRLARLALLAALTALAAACGDNNKPQTPVDAGVDAGSEALAACVDRPTDLPRPPTGQLPCELLPPGFGAR